MRKKVIHKRGLIIAPGLENYLAVITINKEKPDYIAFLTDEVTSEKVGEILKKIKLKQIKYRNFFIKQHVSTLETIQEFFKAFYWLTQEKDCPEIIIDATNTLKPRAIALYMTASFIEVFKEFIGERTNIKLDYIICPFDTKGRPVIGKEKLIKLDEPTDTLSYALAIYAVNLFNSYAFSSAKKTFDILETKTSGNQYLLYSGLKKISSAFEMWDKFQLNKAIEEMEDAIITLRRIKTYIFVNKILPKLEKKVSVLKRTSKKFGLQQIVDIFQNGKRRLEETRYDDAVARFYCCLEMISRYRLAKYNIDPSNPRYDKLSKLYLEEFRKRNGGSLPKEIDLKKGFELLDCLKDNLGKEVKKNDRIFLGLIGMRNLSILAHGTKPISKANAFMFKEKLVEKLLLFLLEQEKVDKEKIFVSHTYIKLPLAPGEFYQQL